MAARLSIVEICNLTDGVLAQFSVNPGNGKPITVSLPPTKASQVNQVTIDQTTWQLRSIRAAAVAWAESDGYTDARCYDYPRPAGGGADPKQPGQNYNCNTPGRGIDRGLWQINSKAHPDVTDVQADTPDQAVRVVWYLSAGFVDWTIWHGSKGLDNNSQQYQDVKAGYLARFGSATDATDNVIPGDLAKTTVAGAKSTIADVKKKVVSLLGWTDGLAKLLSYITSAAFWRRFGAGALGVFLIILAVVLTVAASKGGRTVAEGALAA